MRRLFAIADQPATPPVRPSERMSRRSVLLALGAAPVLTACGLHPPTGRTPDSTGTATRSPSRTPTPASTPAGDGIRVHGTLASTATGENHNWTVIYPPGATAKATLPVAIVLHGMGDNIDALNHLHYDVHLGEAVRAGVPPFALAAIDGGVLFWQRMDGRDAGALVASEFVGVLAGRGLDTSRLALTGWSMGGWGTLRLAGNELAGKLRAIAPISTPLYPDAAAAPERWMSDADYAANNPYTHPELLRDVPIWLACGTSDQFYPGNVSFTQLLSGTAGVLAPATHFTDGGHDFTFWEGITADQFRFLGEHL